MFVHSNFALFRRIASVFICAALLLSITSCASTARQNTPAAEPSVSASSPSAGSAAPSVSPSASPSVHSSSSTNFTENGTGLVRDVPASVIKVIKPADFSGDFDIRWLDCPTYFIGDELQQLLDAFPNIVFNTDTVWPLNMPSDFDPAAIMEAGKNPGLGINSLHDQGITGKGVSIAIIDQTLLTSHVEYKDNLALYEEIRVNPTQPASMHGSAVSSIAVGKSCGVAPDAKLYFWAVNFSKGAGISSSEDKNIAFADGLAVAVDRMLEVNAKLPESEKIRVLSISRGFSDLEDEGVQTFLKAVERAKEAGIFVITTTTFQYYAFITEKNDFGGLGKADFYGSPDDISTYTLGRWQQNNPEFFSDRLLVPMDARTTADFTGTDDYVFYSNGGWSWVAPYLAGLYALAAQVKPDITPEVFWTTALGTASKLTVKIPNTAKGPAYTFNHVINPPALIDALR